VIGLISSVAGADDNDSDGISRGGSVWVGGLTIYF
jgi:hypothetical protein